MPCRLSSSLLSLGMQYQRLFKRSQSISHLLKYMSPSREITQDVSKRHQDEKYAEIRSRLAKVPYLSLLEKEVEHFHQELIYENDKRLEDILNWLSKVFDYNTRPGRMVRAVVFLKAFCTYGFSLDDTDWNQWDSERWKLATILAWCIELFSSYIYITDDIMDQSTLRRGKPCWYSRPEVGNSAVNDAVLLWGSIHKLLRKYFSSSECYVNLFQEFEQTNLETAYGQGLDTLFPKKSKYECDKFTFKSFEFLSEYKTSHYTFRFPIHLAMHMAGGYSTEEFDFTKKLCLKLGLYFQSQDDRLDCYGPKLYTGMIGNDIREGKLTWLSAMFMEVASEEMKMEFLENFGVNDEGAINRVLELYGKAQLLEKFKEFDDLLYKQISCLVESRNDFKGFLFYDLFNEVRHRKVNPSGSS